MLIDELGAVVDLIVHHQEAVLLGVVLSNILVGVLGNGSHADCVRRVAKFDGCVDGMSDRLQKLDQRVVDKERRVFKRSILVEKLEQDRKSGGHFLASCSSLCHV